MHHDVIGRHIAIRHFVTHAIGLVVHLHHRVDPSVEALRIWPQADVIPGLHHLPAAQNLGGAIGTNVVDFSAVLFRQIDSPQAHQRVLLRQCGVRMNGGRKSYREHTQQNDPVIHVATCNVTYCNQHTEAYWVEQAGIKKSLYPKRRQAFGVTAKQQSERNVIIQIGYALWG